MGSKKRPAARQNDSTTVSVANIGTVSGHISSGSPDVFINKRPAARVKDHGRYCVAVMNEITQGSSTVFINGKPAAIKTSSMSLSGRVTDGSPDVFIGGCPDGPASPTPPTPSWWQKNRTEIEDDVRHVVAPLMADSGVGAVAEEAVAAYTTVRAGAKAAEKLIAKGATEAEEFANKAAEEFERILDEFMPHPDAKPPKVGDKTFKRIHPDGPPHDPYTLMPDGKPLGAEAGRMPSNLKGLRKLPKNYEGLRAEGYPDLAYEYSPGEHAEDFANFSDIRAMEIPPGTKIYRIVDENASDGGAYWAFEKPQGKRIWRSDYAVKDSWNDNGYYIEHTVGPGGLKAWVGKAAGQRYEVFENKNFYLSGGKERIFVTPGSIKTPAPQLTGWK